MTRRIFQLKHHVEHPGIQLRKKWLPMLGIEKTQASTLAKMLQLPSSTMASLLRGKKAIDPDIAKGLGRIFNVTPMFWVSLQFVYDKAQEGYLHDGQ